MRLLYMERAFKLPSLTGRAVSRVNDFPAFTTKQHKKDTNYDSGVLEMLKEMRLETKKKRRKKNGWVESPS
jgi:hypothetical protein